MSTTTTGWMPVVLDAALVLFFVVGLVAVAVGLILLVKPNLFNNLSQTVARRYSFRRAMKPLEIPRYKEAFFYRHNLWTGGSILAGALFFMFNVVFRFGPESAAAALPGVDWLWLSAMWVLIVGNTVAVVIGVTILVRPSALKPLEAAANRWVSLRQASRPLDQSHDGMDKLVQTYPRSSGLLLVLAGLFLMASFGLLLAN